MTTVHALCPHCQAEHTLGALTQKQEEVKRFLVGFRAQRGYSPTFAEIADYFGWTSLATVHEIVDAMEKKGHVLRIPHTQRSIQVVHVEAA